MSDGPPSEGQSGGDGAEPEQNHAVPPMSLDTLSLFAELLDHVQLQVNHPEFEQQAQRVIVAKRELAQAFSATATG